MPEIGTSGSMSGDGKRSDAAWPQLPRPSSTLPAQVARECSFGSWNTDSSHETLKHKFGAEPVPHRYRTLSPPVPYLTNLEFAQSFAVAGSCRRQGHLHPTRGGFLHQGTGVTVREASPRLAALAGRRSIPQDGTILLDRRQVVAPNLR
jgi:hypothetical protein